MKIGYIQFDVKYKDINANANTLISYINKYKADLFVAPELCLTGYLFSPHFSQDIERGRAIWYNYC